MDSQIWSENTVFGPWLVESTDAEGLLCALFYAILYMGLEYSWIWASARSPETNPSPIPRDNSNCLRSQNIYGFLIARGSALQIPTLFNGQLYSLTVYLWGKYKKGNQGTEKWSNLPEREVWSGRIRTERQSICSPDFYLRGRRSPKHFRAERG